MSGPAFPFHVDPRNTQGPTDELVTQTTFRRRMRMEAPGVMLVAVPNAGKRTAWERRQRAAEGLTPGFPDMMALFDKTALFLEFKSGTGALSNVQIDCLNRLAAQGFAVGVFRSADTATDWVRGHLPHAFISRAA